MVASRGRVRKGVNAPCHPLLAVYGKVKEAGLGDVKKGGREKGEMS